MAIALALRAAVHRKEGCNEPARGPIPQWPTMNVSRVSAKKMCSQLTGVDHQILLAPSHRRDPLDRLFEGRLCHAVEAVDRR
ncbi:unannotated protein [freshwater metagenome]|uniref:Unannotated protein n=1 Tax=freshwater metagenome TaxID=449393 RepID=A0A6J7NT28_9ZZZZ